MDIGSLFWGGIPIVLLIQGLVSFLKTKLGVKGEWLTVSSLLIGTLFGFLSRLESAGEPTTWQGWLAMGGYGLVCGLVASGSYAQVKRMYEEVRDEIDRVVMAFLEGTFVIVEDDPEGLEDNVEPIQDAVG